MKKQLCFLCLLSSTTISSADDYYKCSNQQKTYYQSTPCPLIEGERQHILQIKPLDPTKQAEAQARFQAWQTEQARQEAEHRKIQQEHNAQAEIAALKQNMAMQKRLAKLEKKALRQKYQANRNTSGHYRNRRPIKRYRLSDPLEYE
ncbi:MAG: hypothetical protein K9L60_03350 [Methylovulum sp.]|jgi:hypothetical protein|nr:hypothetical protein [Methylovulum sp.]MCF7997807.1 hypothetical protein [Methylovulum sp.]